MAKTKRAVYKDVIVKKLILFVTLILVACTTPAVPITKPTAPLATQELATKTQIAMSTETPTSTSLPPSATKTLVNQSTATHQPPATCPAISKKAKLPLNPVFKDKKAPYHDARDVVLNFLNQGGDPKLAIDKLAEFNVHANTWDLTNDGVPEFILPSGYWTVFGCLDGKYTSLLDEPPSEWNMTAVPLAIEDVNQNGMLELLIGQVKKQDITTYKIYEWDGAGFKSLLPVSSDEIGNNIYIKENTIYAVGRSNAEKGAFEGNWEIQAVGDGHKRIVFRAGVFDNYIASSELEQSLTLKWNGDSYVVGKLVTENTPTPLPTSTPLPFSATCSIKAPELQFQYPQDSTRLKHAILEYLNAGGMPERLGGMYYHVTVKDLNNDTAPEVILVDFNFPDFVLLSCQNGKYIEAVKSRINKDFVTSLIDILTITDNNKNGFPEVFIEGIGCVWHRCGGLYVVEWDGTKFVQKIKDVDAYGEIADYADMSDPQDAYLKDLDHDGIAELIWRGEQIPDWSMDRWAFYPGRLATHAFKWDGENYTAQPVEYSPPEFRFQAVQDGDRYSEAGMYEKALQSYQQAITSNALKWWTEDLYNYTVARYGLGPCADNVSRCPTPVNDPNERPILSAYALFRKTLVYLLMNDPIRAESTYQNLLTSYPEGSPGYKITEMAMLFWNEYQSTKSLESACNKSINFIRSNQNALTILTGKSNFLYNQGIDYMHEPEKVCPFR